MYADASRAARVYTGAVARAEMEILDQCHGVRRQLLVQRTSPGSCPVPAPKSLRSGSVWLYNRPLHGTDGGSPDLKCPRLAAYHSSWIKGTLIEKRKRCHDSNRSNIRTTQN